MLGIIKQKLSNINADKRLKEFGKFCFALLQNFVSLGEATEIYASICQVLNSKERCTNVQKSLTSIKNRIAILPEKLTEEDQHQSQFAVSTKENTVPMLTEGTIRRSSPFESHFKEVKDLALSEITAEGALSETTAEGIIENEYWSPDIIKVIDTYMYLYPLWSGSLLTQEGITRDTNADVENWFGVVKNSILQKTRNVHAALFIRKLHIQVEGRTAECTLPLKKATTKEKIIENLEEVWRKTPQKGRKSKYFHSPKIIPTPRKRVASSASKYGRKKRGQFQTDDVKIHINEENVSSDSDENYRETPDALPKLYRPKLIPTQRKAQEVPSVSSKRGAKEKKHYRGNFGHFRDFNMSSHIEQNFSGGEKTEGDSQDGVAKTCNDHQNTRFGKEPGNRPHGIENKRNNCWLNSTLQSFTPLMALFHKVKRNTGNVLFDTCSDKILSLCSTSTPRNITVDDALDILNTDPEYRGEGMEQQDPALLFSEILCELSVQTNVNRLILKYQHSCCRCKKISQSQKEDVFVLSTEIPCAVKDLCVEDCIVEFFKEEVVEKYCGCCQRNTKHIRKSQVCQFPEVLIVQLKRFTPQLKKLHTKITINRKIVLPSIDDVSYQIKAVQTFPL